ncbi:MAG: iron-containing alcohol dehydrogenase [Bdellovibrionales bacterium]|nr:iron-containing alcohol dehydrogenase [Bdellovibrionales bacterium]
MTATATMTRFNYPTRIHYGSGARRLVASAMQENKWKHALIVTDRGVVKLPFMTEFKGNLEQSGLKADIFSEIWGNPVKSQVMAGVNAYKTSRAELIIAVGGGAALDVAKAIALMINHPGDLFDYEDGKPGALPINKAIPPIFALPTTAGTGSEVGRSAVVSDDVTKVKKIIFDPKLLPAQVFVDPELTLNLPAEVTATTGMDALTHLIESFLAVGFHPMADGIALEGIRLCAENLARCVAMAKNPPRDREEFLHVRGMMMNAAYMGAVSFQKGLGVTHSCAHALSTVCDTHHGMANAVLLPYTMKFNAKAVPERFVRMAQAAGLSPATPEAFIKWTIELRKQTGIPHTLKDIGVQESQLPNLVEVALQDGCHQCNPCPVSEEDFRQIYKAAFEGKV